MVISEILTLSLCTYICHIIEDSFPMRQVVVGLVRGGLLPSVLANDYGKAGVQ